MSFLLDTNVVSETRKRAPEPGVLAWLSTVPGKDIFLSVLSLGELHRGVRLKQRVDPQAATALAHWLRGIESLFEDRIVPVDAAVCRQWGELTAARPLPVVDALIAATALVRGLSIVTRNQRDFEGLGVSIVNPWK